MPKPVRWGIIGAGNIARAFARDLQRLEGAAVFEGVGSRSLEKAEAFAKEHGANRAFGSYEDLLKDPDIDAVYVATPHNLHCENTVAALARGKAVLCEKPMAVNEAEVRAMVAKARETNTFCMEAMWTRFMPVMDQVRAWVREGRIGEPRLVRADFGFRAGFNPESRLFNPNLAGGAMLDVGVYTVAFVTMILGADPVSILATGQLAPTGVDEQNAVLMAYENGAIGSITSAVRTSTRHEARVYGTDGYIVLDPFWRPGRAELYAGGEEPEIAEGETGYHFQAAEVARCLEAGEIESPIMPLDESAAIAGIMDEARRQIGVSYPMEQGD